MLKRIKFGVYILPLVAASVAVGVRAQQTHGHTHDQAAGQPQGRTDRHGTTMSHDSCPMMKGEQAKTPEGAGVHSAHLAAVNARGERGMGFSQSATTHHFLLTGDGGAIRVEADDAKDTASRDQIRGHLTHIARMFAGGNFETPMFVHDQVPPGVGVMQRLKAEIVYKYEETDKGALVRISTRNGEALAAIHEFLRFQIDEHQTGDPLEAGRR
ncbi:MAG TPA: hypothetical protein VF538_09875 [Pyrinomonadaceae bacterium]|jgi:hypothetical protein